MFYAATESLCQGPPGRERKKEGDVTASQAVG